MLLSELPRSILQGAALVLGLVWGSFINVVIYRVPRGLSIVRPGSHCPSCKKPIAPFYNIPVISYLALWGRAGCCGARISPRYPLVELIGAMTSLAIVDALVLPFATRFSVGHAGAIYATDLIFALGLIAAAFIDMEHMFLPDPITLGGILLGIGTCSFRGLSYVQALTGTAFGFVVVWLPFGVLYKKVRGRSGMGLGDAKLVALAGAWFGWKGAVFVLFAGAVQGSVAAILLLLIHGTVREPKAVLDERASLQKAAAAGDQEAKEILELDPLGSPPNPGITQARIAFGPFLVMACLEWLFWGGRILENYGI